MENGTLEDIKVLSNDTLREGFYCILVSLLLGFVFDRLFFQRSPGISFFIFIGLCTAFFLYFIRKNLSFEKNMGWFLLIPIGALSFSPAVYSNDIFMLLNILIVPFLMIVSSILINNPKRRWDKLSFILVILRRSISDVLENLFKPFEFINAFFKKRHKTEVKSEKRQILIGLLVSLPILAIIIVLLSSADMVFNYYLNNIASIFENINLSLFIAHTVIILIVSSYLFTYVWSFKSNNDKHENELDNILVSQNSVSWEPITIITVIFVLNILYLVFTLIQFSYLYGGAAKVLPPGFTYAEYARRGFFELAAVTFINFIIVLTCMRFMKQENKKLSLLANTLFTVLILFTINMLFSANFKLSLYEGSYGFTYLRVFVHIFMLLLFILCLITFAGIWYRKIPVVKCIIITSVIMYTLINYVNIDSFIARKNVERYFSTGKLDAYYLTSLSYEAVPYMLQLKNIPENEIKRIINENLQHRKENLDRQNHWSEFNFSRNKVKKLLSKEII